MRIVNTVIARPLAECWRVFTDATTLTAWVPGLRTATVERLRDDGLPEAIRFEFLGGLAYALVYTYDVDERVVRWVPTEDARGAVRGFARFEAAPEGTRFTYALEHDTGRKAAERVLDDPQLTVDAFAHHMHDHQR